MVDADGAAAVLRFDVPGAVLAGEKTRASCSVTIARAQCGRRDECETEGKDHSPDKGAVFLRAVHTVQRAHDRPHGTGYFPHGQPDPSVSQKPLPEPRTS